MVAAAGVECGRAFIHSSPSGDVRLIDWTRASLYPEIPHFLPRKWNYKPSQNLSIADNCCQINYFTWSDPIRTHQDYMKNRN